MSFWQELRDKVRQNKLGTNVTVQALSKIRSAGTPELSIVKPAFYFGQVYTLSLDFIRFVEDLLAANPENKGDVVKGLLYVREASHALLTNVRALAVPLEGLVLDLDDLYESKAGRDEEADEEEEADDEFAPDEASLTESLRRFFGNAGSGDSVSQNLAKAVAGLYRECVHFAEAISELQGTKDGDLEAILGVVLDIQYGLEWQMRFLVEDDVSTDRGAGFVPGVLTWSGLVLNDLVPLLPEAAEKIEA